MERKFKILGIVEPKNVKRTDKSNLQFRIQLDTGQEAFMRYQMARKKYADIFLDYFLEKARKVYNSDEIFQLQEQLIKNENLERQSGKRKSNYELASNKNSLQKYFQTCRHCNSENASGLLDYDAIVPADSTIAIPVYFKLKKQFVEKKSKVKDMKKGKYLKRK